MARLVAWCALGLGAGVAILILGLWIEHTTGVELPPPSGPFAVGRVCLDWSSERTDPFAPTPGTRRELLAWIWYPGVARPGSLVGPFLPLATVAELRRARGSVITDLLTHDLRKVRHHSIEGCAFARTGPCPIVLLRGGASSEVWNYSSLAEELASHGYVVVGIDAPHRTNLVVFPDGQVAHRQPAGNPENLSDPASIDRLLDTWVDDMSAAADQLARLNAPDARGMFAGTWISCGSPQSATHSAERRPRSFAYAIDAPAAASTSTACWWATSPNVASRFLSCFS